MDKKDKEKFKMIATRNFNDQVIINRKSFIEDSGTKSIVNSSFYNKNRAKTQYREKNRGDNLSAMNRVVDKKK